MTLEAPTAELTDTPKTDEALGASHAVIYTDGGFRQTLKLAGWGLHGYFFNEGEMKVGSGAPNGTPAATGYDPATGLKPSITLTHYVDGFGGITENPTNGVAEIHGLLNGLQVADRAGVKDVLFRIDAKYVLQGFDEWMPKWKVNGWKRADGEPIANQALWAEIDETKQRLIEKGVNMKVLWVKGHSGEPGNDLADKAASRAMIAALNNHLEPDIRIRPAKGYWNIKAERNRMISHPAWYFNTQQGRYDVTEDGRHVYYLGDLKTTEQFFGKPLSNASFSVIYLKEADPVMGLVREQMAAIGEGQYQGVTMASLDAIYKPAIYQLLSEFEDKFLIKDRQHQQLVMYRPQPEENLVLAKELRPARLAYNGVEMLQSVERMLQEHLNPGANTRLRSTDITDALYVEESGKKATSYKLKAVITSSSRTLTVKADHADKENGTAQAEVILTLGRDLPDRNTLAALAGEGTKVWAVTMPESPQAIRYAVVVETKDDIGIWAGPYSNILILK